MREANSSDSDSLQQAHPGSCNKASAVRRQYALYAMQIPACLLGMWAWCMSVMQDWSPEPAWKPRNTHLVVHLFSTVEHHTLVA
jgi:hypothetical protein